MNSAARKYLSSIGAKGGKSTSEAKRAAVTDNLRKAREAKAAKKSATVTDRADKEAEAILQARAICDSEESDQAAALNR